MSEVNLAAGGYLYRGTLQDAPAARRRPGRRPASMSSRVLKALTDLGGEASTTEIRQAIGTVPAPRRVPDALHQLRIASEVTAVGDARGGQGNPQRWRRKYGRPRGPLTRRVLKVIRDLGGEASTAEIRRALAESGMVPDGPRVLDALHWLARTSPAEVTAVGDPRGGRGRTQRWRLT